MVTQNKPLRGAKCLHTLSYISGNPIRGYLVFAVLIGARLFILQICRSQEGQHTGVLGPGQNLGCGRKDTLFHW